MDKSVTARLLAVVMAIVTFIIAATQQELVGLGIAAAAAVTASVAIWLQPPSDLGKNWPKLRDHLILSVPLAGLAVVTGTVVITADGVFMFAGLPGIGGWLSLVLVLLAPASALEQRLMATTPP